MKTPICDFINEYAKSDALRLHMPGHKGKSQLGFEALDITEITGADSLYRADGIIKESEENATLLFESGATLYSTEGSSHVIRAMLYLAKLYSGENDGYVLAGRNAHSSFISACALCDLDVEWIFPKAEDSYLSCVITPEILENTLSRVDKKPVCVYVTSPDYLGNMCDIEGLSRVCQKHNTLLVVDNAHGAYLKFLENDMHPISLGATMCADSAHKTLPVLTGGAYLHISKAAPDFFKENAKSALSLFGSTSPSYLTLASLDNANKYIAEGFPKRLNEFIKEMTALTSGLTKCALSSLNGLREPLKIALQPTKIGYSGGDFAALLEKQGIICEFYDSDFLVLMPSYENGIDEIKTLCDAISKIEVKDELQSRDVPLEKPMKKMSVRQAMFAPCERVLAREALGRVLARSCVSCPPAVSLIVCGEEFNESTVALCKKYGFESFLVVKK